MTTYKCHKCGLLAGDDPMGSVLPQCKCFWFGQQARAQMAQAAPSEPEWKRQMRKEMVDELAFRRSEKMEAEQQAAQPADNIDAIALAAAQEIALMWGRDRSQFVSKIQVAVARAMRAAQPADPVVGTKTWFDGEKLMTQELPASQVYKDAAAQEPIWCACGDGITPDSGEKPEAEAQAAQLAVRDWVNPEVLHMAEDADALHLNLDEQGVPRADEEGAIYSLWGRVLRFAAPQPAEAQERKLWLWKNFVDGRPEYWAFDNPYPTNLDNADPQTVGQPCGYAIFKPSRDGSCGRTEDQVLREMASLRTAPPARQPLTDAEIWAIYADWHGKTGGQYAFARAVIAAYEAKNGITAAKGEQHE